MVGDFEQEEQTVKRYEELTERCEEQKWEIEYHHVVAGSVMVSWKVFLVDLEDILATVRRKSRKSKQNPKKQLKGHHYQFGRREMITPVFNTSYM